MRVLLCALLLTMFCLSLPVLGQDTLGGIFIRDLRITNNGNSVFSEDFNKEELSGWTTINSGISTKPSTDDSTKLCLYMNRETDEKTAISHKIVCSSVSAFELSAYVYLPSPEQQWAYSHGSRVRTRIDIETGQGEDSFYIPIDLNPGETGYRVGLAHVRPETMSSAAGLDTYDSKDVVVKPQRWTLVSLKLDPNAKTATVFVDGKAQASCDYTPSKVRRVEYVDLTTWMGDKERATEEPTTDYKKTTASKKNSCNCGSSCGSKTKKKSGGCGCGCGG